MPTHLASTNSYLRSNSSVLTAGRELQSKLGRDSNTLESAITQLEEAASQQDVGAASYRAFMFSALGKTRATQKEARQRISGDILASVVADLQVGSVFVAAGAAVGETGGGKAGAQEGQRLLHEALNSMEETTPAIKRGLSTPISAGAKPGRFNFPGTAIAAEPKTVDSADAKSPAERFRSLSQKTMGTFVSEFREVAVSVLQALEKPLEKIEIFDALKTFGGPLLASPTVGRLIKKGIEKIQSAVDALVNLIGSAALKKVKRHIEDLWSKIGKKKVDEWGTEKLADFIGVNATREAIEDVLKADLKKKTVDAGIKELMQLQQPYKDNMELSKKAVKAISTVGGVLFALPIAGKKVALFAAVSYLAILSVALLIAMDYCDSGEVLQRVRGVGEIAKSLRA